MAELKIPDELTQDCENCQGLCCVVPQHNRGDGFPIFRNKPMNTPCRNLEMDPDSQTELYKCKIHAELEDKKWHTCDGYTCFGAGQTISKFFNELGVSWAMKPDSANEEEWQLMVKNLYACFVILDATFESLNSLKYLRHPLRSWIYKAAREAAGRVAEELSSVIQNTDEVIDYHYWCEYRFKPAIREAINEVKRENSTSPSVVPASRLSAK